MLNPLSISGFVLAGGHSSRMGRDKALIPLAGKPLIAHAILKLRRICADVHILSNDSALADFAPVIADIHPDCGPIGGMEAALTRTAHNWNLFLPVDMPFVPTSLLFNRAQGLMDAIISDPATNLPGIHYLNIDGGPQPALCLIHRGVAPLITRSILRGQLALRGVFEDLGRELPSGPSNLPIQSFASISGEAPSAWPLTPAQSAARKLWFSNLNTPEDLAFAEANSAALDT